MPVLEIKDLHARVSLKELTLVIVAIELLVHPRGSQTQLPMNLQHTVDPREVVWDRVAYQDVLAVKRMQAYLESELFLSHERLEVAHKALVDGEIISRIDHHSLLPSANHDTVRPCKGCSV